jgi:hypothetical protein
MYDEIAALLSVRLGAAGAGAAATACFSTDPFTFT